MIDLNSMTNRELKRHSHCFTLSLIGCFLLLVQNMSAAEFFVPAPQQPDTINLIYPIPQEDGNPNNQSSSGFYFNDPPNITRQI